MSRKILVCTRGKKCPRKGSCEIYDLVKDNAGPDTTVVGSKCLGMCKHGPSVVVMPGKLKFKKVSKSEAKTIAAGEYSTSGKPASSDKKKKKKKSKKSKKKKD